MYKEDKQEMKEYLKEYAQKIIPIMCWKKQKKTMS